MSLNQAAIDYARQILGDYAIFIGVGILIISPFVVIYMKLSGRKKNDNEP